MRLAVTGAAGQVVRSLVERSNSDRTEVVTLARPQFDLAWSFADISRAIADANPDVIVSAAAYTQVDKAESEPELAFAVNEHGARAVAIAARELAVPLIHLSTDYVFDGTNPLPYLETDRPAPMGVYGKSKLAGEIAVLDEHSNSAVLRTAWVYSPFGSNFVKTMLRLATQRQQIDVVDDQRGNPTSAFDIAGSIAIIAANLLQDRDPTLRGVFHMTARGNATWAELAEEIFALSAEAGGASAAVQPIPSAQFPTLASRPANSQLNSGKLERAHRIALPDWHSSLKDVVRRLAEEGEWGVSRK